MIDTEDGKSMLLTLLNHGDVWALNHLKDKIIKGDTYASPPFYVRPLGHVRKTQRTSITHMI